MFDTPAPPAPVPAPEASTIVIEESILERAKQGDAASMATMFTQFLCEDETILLVEYLGKRGFLFSGEHCWACVTDRRAGSLRVGKIGELVYQDALLEGINSSAIHQPSLLPLYIGIVVIVLLSIPTFGVLLLTIPLAIHLYFRHSKCGLWFIVREGLNVWMFANRKRLTLANRIYRTIIKAREKRVETLGIHIMAARS